MIDTIISAETAIGGVSQPGYVLAPDVILVLVRDGTGRLLDLGGSFYALAATAATMLHEALREDPLRAAARLAARYKVQEQQIWGDLRRFLNELERKGLIRHRGLGLRLSKRRWLLASLAVRPILRGIHAWPGSVRVKAKVLLGLAYLSLRLLGLSGTIAAWRQYHRHSRAWEGHGDRETVVREVDEAVRCGATYHFLNTECKERALCCWSLLRAHGFPAQIVLGIALYPFAGHCWCELDGQVLTDDEDRCERFTPVLTYA
jgi:hypothetical protein